MHDLLNITSPKLTRFVENTKGNCIVKPHMKMRQYANLFHKVCRSRGSLSHLAGEPWAIQGCWEAALISRLFCGLLLSLKSF